MHFKSITIQELFNLHSLNTNSFFKKNIFVVSSNLSKRLNMVFTDYMTSIRKLDKKSCFKFNFFQFFQYKLTFYCS